MGKGIIHVCGLSAMPRIVTESGAASLVSLINGDMLPATPAGLAAERHLQLVMNDISLPREGLVVPAAAHVERLIAFFRAWDRCDPLVIHCWAGISRSSAAAFIALVALKPEANEHALAELIRARSATATPNQRLVALADHALSRDGRMIDAIAAIGRGRSAMEGAPYAIEI